MIAEARAGIPGRSAEEYLEGLNAWKVVNFPESKMNPERSIPEAARNRPPTLEDLGQILGLSKRAVSQALYDRAGTVKVSAATRERVRQLAKTLGYRKNMAATALTTKRTGMFGILTSVGRMHVSAIQLATAVAEFRRLGHSPLVIHDDAKTTEQHDFSLSALINARVDGVLLIRRPPHFTDHHVEELRQYGMSVVQVGSTTPALNISHFLTDRSQAFQLIVDHLVAQGYRRLGAIVGSPESLSHPTWGTSASRQTRTAILEAVNQARNAGTDLHLEIHECPKISNEEYEMHELSVPGYEAMRHIIKEKKVPEALICQVDGWAWGAMRACAEAGLRIPDDMAITGYSNEPACSATYVPLTSVAEPFEEMCQAAVDELIAAVKDRRPTHRQAVFLPHQLIVRKSSLNPRL